MNFHRAYFLLSFFAALTICLALGISLAGYFHAVEKGSAAVGSEKRLLGHLKMLGEGLKRAEGPEEAKAALKTADALTGFGPESELSKELRRVYAPVMAVFAGKPREAEPRFQISKKRELMETLVNSYRKEVLHGDIRIRAGYLNVLFDTQASLLNDSDEAEEVFLRRNRERLDGLRSLGEGTRDAAVVARVAAIDGILQSYDRGFQLALKWRADKADALAKAEKELPSIAKGIYSGQDSGMDESRRGFLYICFLSVLFVGVSLLSLFLGFKVMKVRSEIKVDAFLSYLRAFGTERTDPQLRNAVQSLRDDSAWAPVLAEAESAEESFLRSCHNQLAVPRSLTSPFLVVGKERTIRYWNGSAAALFGLNEEREWDVFELLQPDRVAVKGGTVDALLELMKSSLASLSEERFHLMVKESEGWTPFELTLSPITSGPLAGGKVFLWREIRGEAERLDRAVASQVERLRELVHQVTHEYEADFTAKESDAPSAKIMIADLARLKAQLNEKAHLWRSEAQALIDQINRQQEILSRFGEELTRVRLEQAEALETVRTMHGGEEHLHDEVCVMERDLERWTNGRRRLLRDLETQSATLERARRFEEQLRKSNDEMSQELDTFDSDVNELKSFAEAAKVQSVNLSLVRDPALWEYASRTRAFAEDLSRFAARAEALGRTVRAFLKAHPGGALAAHLGGASVDAEQLSALAEEQERLGTVLKRWRESGELLLSGSEKAQTHLQEAEKKGAMLSQLGETSLLINQQAKGNLERWN